MSKRLKFFIGHLTISALIALLVTWLIFFIWYPAPLASALGVTTLFFMLIIIDVIIGPLLGLLIYKEGKKTLKFDLATVIIIQITAFSYGFYTIAEGRPVWIAYDSLAFHIVKNSDIDNTHIKQAKPEFQHPSWFKPQFVALNTDQNTPARTLLNQIPQGTIAIDHPMYYADISEAKLRIQLRAFPMYALQKYNDPQQLKKIISKYPEADGWFGLTAPIKSLVVLVNKEQGKIIAIVDLKPWH